MSLHDTVRRREACSTVHKKFQGYTNSSDGLQNFQRLANMEKKTIDEKRGEEPTVGPKDSGHRPSGDDFHERVPTIRRNENEKNTINNEI